VDVKLGTRLSINVGHGSGECLCLENNSILPLPQLNSFMTTWKIVKVENNHYNY